MFALQPGGTLLTTFRSSQNNSKFVENQEVQASKRYSEGKVEKVMEGCLHSTLRKPAGLKFAMDNASEDK